MIFLEELEMAEKLWKEKPNKTKKRTGKWLRGRNSRNFDSDKRDKPEKTRPALPNTSLIK
jgi:hypothetical protein